jgi:hypothetical protein
VSFETEQFKELEKSQPREFWDSQPLCPLESQPQGADIQGKRSDRAIQEFLVRKQQKNASR